MRPSTLQHPFCFLIHSFHGSKAVLGLGLIILKVSRSYSDTTYSVVVTQVGKTFFLYGKIKGDLDRFDVTELKYGIQNALSLTNIKGEGFKVKNYLFNKNY
jgi:hypothetical protein